jgi:hypothetical protein
VSSLVAALTVLVPLLACVALWTYARAGSIDSDADAAPARRSLSAQLVARWRTVAAVDVAAAVVLVSLDAAAAGRMVRLGAPFVGFFALWAVVVRRATAAGDAPDPAVEPTRRTRDDSRRATLLPVVGVIAAVLVVRALLAR